MPFTLPKIVKFSQAIIQIPSGYDIISNDGHVKGQILSDLTHCWHIRGPHLEVRDVKTGRKVAAWTFGYILKDVEATRIVCIEEMRRPHSRLGFLVVALENDMDGGMVCLFEVFGSKVIQAVKVPKKITSLHIVDSGLEPNHIPGPLRSFNGVIAVGTEDGDVYLIDIGKQLVDEDNFDVEINNELNPSELRLISHRELAHIDNIKCSSAEDRQLALHLNAVSGPMQPHFTLKGPEGDDRLFVNRAEVTVSALLYCPQLTSLIIGYNFGAFQIWDLKSLKLVYTSPVCDEHIPITHFAFMEPADDPRAFCYIWVAYSYSEIDAAPNCLPFIVMYSLSFQSKEYLEGYGCLYNNFQYCSVRFQRELGSDAAEDSGYCKGFQTIAKTFFNDCLEEPDSCGDSLSLFSCSWSTFSKSNNKQSTFLMVFDLNQWYKEQMPSSTNWKDCQGYIYKAPLENKGALICDLKINRKGLRQFTFSQKLDELFHPSALSFDIFLLRHTDVTIIRNEGVQKAFLLQMEASGSLCLVRPQDFCQQVFRLGLNPLFVENSCREVAEQRELLLSVALEQKLTRWLCRVASDWANGSFTASSGCCLDFLMDWAFRRAVLLKNNCDSLVIPLFDYSLSKLDKNACNLLNNCTRQLNNIKLFYNFALHELKDFLSNLDIIKEQFQLLEAVCVYLEVLQWMMNVGLLPEGQESNPYPVEQIAEYFHERRAELKVHSTGESLLFIDNLINRKCGAEMLQKQWQDDDGSGLYPPPSLQSLLRSYLIKNNADPQYKHALVLYVFLDLTKVLRDDDFNNQFNNLKTNLIKFPAVFKLSNNLIKITQAFWMLDHGDYNAAMDHLLDPFVTNNDLEHWQHVLVLKTLQMQNQNQLALYYLQVRKPDIKSTDDLLTTISLFTANGMLDEAFKFQKSHGNDIQVLYHLFDECRKNNLLKAIIYRQLKDDEEKAFLKYLNELRQPAADDLQIFYYLLRTRFIEALDIYDRIPANRLSSQLVKMLKNLLPQVNQQLIDFVRSQRNALWKEMQRLEPLFFTVAPDKNKKQIHYKSTIINKALCKARQTFNSNQSILGNSCNVTEEIPFLKTPTAEPAPFKFSTPIINSKVVLDDSEADDEFVPSPAKRLKLSSRNNSDNSLKMSMSMQSLILTPIVRRKLSPINKNENQKATPQSILKVRNEKDFSLNQSLESPKKLGLNVSPRRSLLSKSPKYPVRFDEDGKLAEEESIDTKNTNPNKESSSEEDFFSPETSAEDQENQDEAEKEILMEENVEEIKKPLKRPYEDSPTLSNRLSDRLRARKPLFRQVLEYNAFKNVAATSSIKIEEKIVHESSTISTTTVDDRLIEKTLEQEKRECFKHSDVELSNRVVRKLSLLTSDSDSEDISGISLEGESFDLTLPSFLKYPQPQEDENKQEGEVAVLKDLQNTSSEFTTDDENNSSYEYSLDMFSPLQLYFPSPAANNQNANDENECSIVEKPIMEEENNHDLLISGAVADIEDEKSAVVLDDLENVQNPQDNNIGWENMVYEDLSNSNSKKYELNADALEDVEMQEEIPIQHQSKSKTEKVSDEVIEIESTSSESEDESSSSSKESIKSSNKSTSENSNESRETVGDSIQNFERAYLDIEVSELQSDECNSVSTSSSWVQKPVNFDEGFLINENSGPSNRNVNIDCHEIIIEEIKDKTSSSSSSNDVQEKLVILDPVSDEDKPMETITEENEEKIEKKFENKIEEMIEENNEDTPIRQRGRPKKGTKDVEDTEILIPSLPRLRRSTSRQPEEKEKEKSDQFTPSRLRRSSRRLSKADSEDNKSIGIVEEDKEKTFKAIGPTPSLRKLRRCMSVELRTNTKSSLDKEVKFDKGKSENSKGIFDKKPDTRKQRSKSVDQINMVEVKPFNRKSGVQATNNSPICKELRVNVIKSNLAEEKSPSRKRASTLAAINEESGNEAPALGKIVTRRQSNLLKNAILKKNVQPSTSGTTEEKTSMKLRLRSRSVDFESAPAKRTRKNSTEETVKTPTKRASLRTRSTSISSTVSDGSLSTAKVSRKIGRKQSESNFDKIAE